MIAAVITQYICLKIRNRGDKMKEYIERIKTKFVNMQTQTKNGSNRGGEYISKNDISHYLGS